MRDEVTHAIFTECHVQAEKLIEYSTIDVPLDPDEQSEYRANRNIVEDNGAFLSMKADALKGRPFSNIVAEFTLEFDKNYPLKIIGGQHRFEAIDEAYKSGMNVYHGVKVYLLLIIIGENLYRKKILNIVKQFLCLQKRGGLMKNGNS